MEQKRVSFKVAKALKEAGYPQWETPTVYVLQECKLGNVTIPQGYEKRSWGEDDYRLHPDGDFADIPTYLDVWLWLWREKNTRIYTRDYYGGLAVSESSSSYDSINYADPEEAIIAAIEYLVDNNLLK